MKKLLVLTTAFFIGFLANGQSTIEKRVGDGVTKVIVVSKDAAEQVSDQFKSKRFKRHFKGYKRHFKGYRKSFKRSFAVRKGHMKRVGKRTAKRIKVALKN